MSEISCGRGRSMRSGGRAVAALGAALLTLGLWSGSVAAASSPYSRARTQWIQGAAAISARQGAYWTRAEKDLRQHLAPRGAQRRSYQRAIRELNTLRHLPETGVTTGQRSQASSAIASLDNFFDTPGLYD